MLDITKIQEDKKIYAEYKKINNIRLEFLENKPRDYNCTDKKKNTLLALALAGLMEDIVCSQLTYSLDTIATEHFFRGDDILLMYYDQYKPFFSGHWLNFFTEQDFTSVSYMMPYRQIFNYVAYEISINNPYVKTFLTQIYKVTYPDLWYNLQNTPATRKMNMDDLFSYGRFVEKVYDVDEEDERDKIREKIDEEDKITEKLCILLLYAWAIELPLKDIFDSDKDKVMFVAKFEHLAYKVLDQLLDSYSKEVPVWMETRPSKEEWEGAIYREDNATVSLLMKDYGLDLSKKNMGFPLYYKLKRLGSRITAFHGIDTEGVVKEDKIYDIVAITKAHMFLKWMFGNDTSKITKDLLQSAAAITNVYMQYFEMFNHFNSNVETLTYIQEKPDIKINMEADLDIDSRIKIQIADMCKNLKEEQDKTDILERRIRELEEENLQLRKRLKTEEEKRKILSDELKEQHNSEWIKLEKLYADQVEMQNEEIRIMQEKYKAVSDNLSEYKKKADRLDEVNKALSMNAASKAADNQNRALLQYGEEPEFFDGEMEDFILESLTDYLNNYVPKGSRRAHMIASVLTANKSKALLKNSRMRLKEIFHDSDAFRNVENSFILPELEREHFKVISTAGKHIKIAYYGDTRYQFTIAKTTSDYRAASNLYSIVSNLCL